MILWSALDALNSTVLGDGVKPNPVSGNLVDSI